MELITCSSQLSRGLAACHNSLGLDAPSIPRTYAVSSSTVGGRPPCYQRPLDMGAAARAADEGRPNLFNLHGWPNTEVRKLTLVGLREELADQPGGGAYTLAAFEEVVKAAAGGPQHVQWVRVSAPPAPPPPAGQQQGEGRGGREVTVVVLCNTQRAAVAVAVAASRQNGSLTQLPIYARAAPGAAAIATVGRPQCLVTPEQEQGAAGLGAKTVTVALAGLQLRPGAAPGLDLLTEREQLQLACAEAIQQTQDPDVRAILDVLSISGGSQRAPHLLHLHYGSTRVAEVLSSHVGAELCINTSSMMVQLRLSPLDTGSLKYAVLLELPEASAARSPDLLCKLLHCSVAAAEAFSRETLGSIKGAKPLTVEFVAADGSVWPRDKVDPRNVMEVMRTYRGLPLCCLLDPGLAVDPRRVPRLAVALTTAAAQFAVVGGHWRSGARLDNGFVIPAGTAAASDVGESQLLVPGASLCDPELMAVAVGVAEGVPLDKARSTSSSDDAAGAARRYMQSLCKLAADSPALDQRQLTAPSPVKQRVDLLQMALDMAAAEAAAAAAGQGGAGEASAGETPPAKRQQYAAPGDAIRRGQESFRRAQQAIAAEAGAGGAAGPLDVVGDGGGEPKPIALGEGYSQQLAAAGGLPGAGGGRLFLPADPPGDPPAPDPPLSTGVTDLMEEAGVTKKQRAGGDEDMRDATSDTGSSHQG